MDFMHGASGNHSDRGGGKKKNYSSERQRQNWISFLPLQLSLFSTRGLTVLENS